MTNMLQMAGNAAKMKNAAPDTAGTPLHQRFWFVVAVYCLVVIASILLTNLPNAVDYVGRDNDDRMRLIEVRDLLAGQSWFDMMQYRLGLAGGTPMHWSRFIDLPIAGLIAAFRIVLAPEQAEAVALAIWPLTTAAALLFVMGFAGRRIGGVAVMHAALFLTGIFLFTSNRFGPGAIDHHNVQLVLVAFVMAMLIDPAQRPANYVAAGIAAALALSIGAETTPHIAVACLAVAMQWAWHGKRFAPAARAYSLALVMTITAAFFLTVPPRLYALVTCDSLSLGYYGLASAGASLLFLSALLANGLSRTLRFGVLAVDGALVLAAALMLAPQCLGNPLSNLDPLLVKLWLNNVTEAQSFLEEVRLEPGAIGGFYACGLLAISVCVFRILRAYRVELHAILLAFVLVSWAIALIQVRGAIFSNLLSILPLSLLVMDLRKIARNDPENMGASFSFLVTALMSVPMVWALGGLLATDGVKGLVGKEDADAGASSCLSRSALSQLAAIDTGLVAAPSDFGTHILRYTSHRVLTAPYHRNQAGMLTALHIGLSTPADALALIRGAGVTVVAYCRDETETLHLAEIKPDGLYAQLAQDKVPAYLDALPVAENSSLRVYKVLPAGGQ